MANLTRDELTAATDAAIEVAISTLQTAGNLLDRAGALRLLTRRMVRKNVTNRVRQRSATLA
jgi:hypothetical protein